MMLRRIFFFLVAAFALCALSYGTSNSGHYVLVYKGSMRAVKTIFDVNDANDLLSRSIRGYWAVDINDTGVDKGEVLDSNAVVYSAPDKYYKVVPDGIIINPHDPCRVELLSFDMMDGDGEAGFDVLGKGRLTKVYDDHSKALRKYVPIRMKGGGFLSNYNFFDPTDTDTGIVGASIILDSKLTRNANSNGDNVDQVINGVVTQLTRRGGWTEWPAGQITVTVTVASRKSF
jgi:hypothetical protein